MPKKPRQSEKKSVGRPWTADGRRTLITVRVSDREHDLLQLAARGEDVAVSTLIRRSAVAAAAKSVSRLG